MGDWRSNPQAQGNRRLMPFSSLVRFAPLPRVAHSRIANIWKQLASQQVWSGEDWGSDTGSMMPTVAGWVP